MERILNMILRRLARQGVNSGLRAISKRGQNGDRPSQKERQMAQQAKQSSKNMRQASKILRRLNKF